jgi:hypothetical protein
MKISVAALLFCVMLCTACSTAWVSTIDSILAVAAPALIDILQIVAAANGQLVDATQVSKIDADAASIKSLASELGRASAIATPGVCSALQSAITTYQADQQVVLSAAQVSDVNTQAKIVLLSNFVAGTVNAILAVVPSCDMSQAALRPNTALHLTDFVANYNAILTAKTGDPAVDAITEKLRLHRHCKAVRIATLGRLQ